MCESTGKLMNPLISVVVPIYNVEEYLIGCIESMIKQVFSDMEIILVVFDEYSNSLGKKLFPELEEYIDRNYVDEKQTA